MFTVVTYLSIVIALGGSTAMSSSLQRIDCSSWTAATLQKDVPVSGSVVLDQSCIPFVSHGVGITLYCSPSTDIVINNFRMTGGYISVVGPLSTPWIVLNVSVAVVNTTITAVDGPAVGLILGFGLSSSDPSLVMIVSNVSFLAADSVLSSSTTTSNSGACVLGITLSGYVSAATQIVNFTVVTFDTSMFSSATTATVSAVAGIALSHCRQLEVRRSNMTLIRSTATAWGGAASAVTVGGVAVGLVDNAISATSLTFQIGWCNVSTATSSVLLGAAGTIAGVGVGFAGSSVTIDSIATYVGWSTAYSQVSSAQRATATIGGVAVGYVSLDTNITNLLAYFGWSNGTANATSGQSTAANVAGVSIAYSVNTLLLSNATLYIGWSVCFSQSRSELYYAASSVGGVALGTFSSGITLSNLTLYAVWMVADGQSVGSLSAASASVCGISVASTGGTTTVSNITAVVFLSACSSTSTSAVDKVTSAVGSLAVGSSSSSASVVNIKLLASGANITCAASGSIGSISSAVTGVAFGSAGAEATLSSLLLYSTSNNVTSVSWTVAPPSSLMASAICGIAISLSQGGFTASSLVILVTQSRLNASAAGTGQSFASTVGGVSVSSNSMVKCYNATTSVLDSDVNSSAVGTRGTAASSIAGVAVGGATTAATSTIVSLVRRSTALSYCSCKAMSVATSVGGVAMSPMITTTTVNGTQADIRESNGNACALCVSCETACGLQTSLVDAACCALKATLDSRVAVGSLPSWNAPPLKMPFSAWFIEWDMAPPPTKRSWTRSTSPKPTRSVSTTFPTLTATFNVRTDTHHNLHRPRNITNTKKAAAWRVTPTPLHSPFPNRTLTRLPATTLYPTVSTYRAKPSPTDSSGTFLGHLGLDETTVTIMLATASGGTAISGALSPTWANKATVVSRAILTATCPVSQSSPSPWTLLPGFLVLVSDAASMAVSTLLFALVVLYVSVWLA